MDAITRGLGPDSATEQEIDEAMGGRARKVWKANDGIFDLFPANAEELQRMRELWPRARGPRFDEIGVPVLTSCCQAGTVGWIDHVVESPAAPGGMYFTRHVGRENCFYCGRLVGSY